MKFRPNIIRKVKGFIIGAKYEGAHYYSDNVWLIVGNGTSQSSSCISCKCMDGQFNKDEILNVHVSNISNIRVK